MWVRKPDEELAAEEQERKKKAKRLWPRLNPLRPVAAGVAIYLLFSILTHLGAPSKFSNLPRHGPTLWDALEFWFPLGFLVGFIGAYVIQFFRMMSMADAVTTMCPKCHKVEGDEPPCQCGLPREPINWWRWMEDDDGKANAKTK